MKPNGSNWLTALSRTQIAVASIQSSKLPGDILQ
jgi:hypothetical protein